MNCNKCKSILEERTHKVLTDKMLRQPFYYNRWYVCPSCGWRMNYEQDKIFNKTSFYRNNKIIDLILDDKKYRQNDIS